MAKDDKKDKKKKGEGKNFKYESSAGPGLADILRDPNATSTLSYGKPESVADVMGKERPTRGMGSGAAYRPSSHAGGMRTTGPNYADRVGNQKMPSRSGGGVAPYSKYGEGVGDNARAMARAYWDRMRARNADRPTPQAQGGRSWPNMASGNMGGGNLSGLAALARVIMGQQIGPGGTLNLPYYGGGSAYYGGQRPGSRPGLSPFGDEYMSPQGVRPTLSLSDLQAWKDSVSGPIKR